MSIFLDVTVFVIIGLTLFFVIKKGFVKSLLDLLSVICSIILSKMFAPAVSSFFYNGFKDTLVEKIENVFWGMLQNNAFPEVLEYEKLKLLTERYNLNFSDLSNNAAIEDSLSAFAETITGFLSYCLAYIVIFLVVIVAFKLITPLICLIFKLPVLSTINRLLSVVLAIALAAVYLLVFVAVMQLLIPFLMSIYPEHINEGIISASYVFEYLYNLQWLNIFVC